MKHSVGILVHSAAVVAVVAAVFSSCFSFEEPEKKTMKFLNASIKLQCTPFAT